MRSLLAASLVAAALLAGCSGSSSTDKPVDTLDDTVQDVYAPVRDLLQGVPCEATTSPASGTTDNIVHLANATFLEAYSRDIDIRGDLILSPGADGIGIMDISDPLNPVVLSELRDIGGELDVKFSPDNQTAILGVRAGVVLVDIRDVHDPRVMHNWTWSMAGGLPGVIQDPILGTQRNGHMVYSARIAEKDWVFVAPNANSGVWVLELVGEPGNQTLEFRAQTLPVQGGPLGPHDMWVTYDEAAGAWLLYSADGFHGWTVFNVDNPAAPMLVGGLIRPETGYTHTIQAGFVDGRRIVATIQEVGVNLLEVYDATNLRAPVLLATWSMGPTELVQPQHNIQIVNGTLYVAHYNSGVFVFDLRDAGTVPAAGSASFGPMGRWDPGNGHDAPAIDFGGIYDVVVHNGLVYASGYSGAGTGITVLGFGCLQPGDIKLTSTG
jgi:hypothetical protein